MPNPSMPEQVCLTDPVRVGQAKSQPAKACLSYRPDTAREGHAKSRKSTLAKGRHIYPRYVLFLTNMNEKIIIIFQ